MWVIKQLPVIAPFVQESSGHTYYKGRKPQGWEQPHPMRARQPLVTLCPPVTTPLSDQTTTVECLSVCICLPAGVCGFAGVYVKYAKKATETKEQQNNTRAPLCGQRCNYA